MIREKRLEMAALSLAIDFVYEVSKATNVSESIVAKGCADLINDSGLIIEIGHNADDWNYFVQREVSKYNG